MFDIFSFGCEQGIFIVEEYDQKSLQPMFLKCYDHLHHVENYDVKFTKHKSYEDNSLDFFDIFEMTTNTSEPMVELVNKKTLDY